ncbi:hypothetical protein [Vibrio alginolyticus]|uniref:hypothetical protein n=1 Tax=Vibrio alginolyticus TaxID=663 RepID=UPI000722FCDA|nr:hypothetical protein [Vibrio alginolyticus]ALR91321.1 hypothetical protein AT730_02540 [Vibrio alginolyticus]MBY7707991.1 hypothetical protein [Vibrio alginolyticus]
MKWDSDTGATPESFEAHINRYYENFKSSDPKFTNLAFNAFVASDEYKVFYSAAQIDMYADSVFAETFLRLTDYIERVNLKIANPTTVPNAMVKGFWDDFGIRANIKPMLEEDRGKLHIALDYSTNPDLVDGPELEYQIGSWLEKTRVVAGVVTVGDIEQIIVIEDSIPETYRWTLAKETPIKFKTTLIQSRTTSAITETLDEIAAKFNANFSERYWVGRDLEPERYLEINTDCEYAADIITSYSLDDGETWLTEPFQSTYDVKFVGELAADDITIQEDA